MSRVEPSITCQRIALRRRSTAASVPHGGAVHGSPSGEASSSRRMPYGVPAWRANSESG